MIAMALACDPDLVVADEPTTALDVMVQAQVLDVLSGMVREYGVGMLMISHDLSVLAELCDRITVMYAGRVVEEGPASEIFTAPLHPYAAALSAAFPRVGDPAARFAPAGLPGDPPDPRQLTAGCSFAPRCPRAAEVCLVAEPELATYGDRAAACVRIEPSRDPVGRARRTSRRRRPVMTANTTAELSTHGPAGRVHDPQRPRGASTGRRRPGRAGRRGRRAGGGVGLRQDDAGPRAWSG